MDIRKIRLIAFDLDGTLTQHKSPLSTEARQTLDRLSAKYKLLMAGAGMCERIFRQMGNYPVDILGNYGMQYAEYRPDGTIRILENRTVPVDRESVERRVTALRERFGCTEYTGDNVEYHPSGCLTFPVLGTKAKIEDKLAYDPDRRKRRVMYPAVCEMFPDYTVFLGGSSSFDMAPFPYNKGYALKRYCEEHGFAIEETAYAGDDYGPGGNDESVLKAGFPFVRVDDYRDFPSLMEQFL